MTASAVTVRDMLERGESHLVIVCRKCPRHGRYALPRLLADRGGVGLPDLLAELSADCPRRQSVGAFDMCGARYEGLVGG